MKELCRKIDDGIIKYSMQKQSIDNVSVIFVVLKILKIKWKVLILNIKKAKAKTKHAKEQYDFSQQI